MSNTLEKVAHQYHMHEIYMRAAEMYQEMEKDSTLDRTFCSCANDIVANGVLAELAGVAKTFKYRARNGRRRSCNNQYNNIYIWTVGHHIKVQARRLGSGHDQTTQIQHS